MDRFFQSCFLTVAIAASPALGVAAFSGGEWREPVSPWLTITVAVALAVLWAGWAEAIIFGATAAHKLSVLCVHNGRAN